MIAEKYDRLMDSGSLMGHGYQFDGMVTGENTVTGIQA
jgi:hypothetical protein